MVILTLLELVVDSLSFRRYLRPHNRDITLMMILS